MMHVRQHSDEQAGFTMAELLITMLLIAVVMIGLAALQLSTIRQVTVSNRAGEATRLAQLVLERYKTFPYADLASFAPKGSWVKEKKKDGLTDMVNVGVDGQSAGAFSVHSLHETVGGGELVTVRVSWLNVDRGLESDQTKQYKEFDVTMAVQRYP